MKRAVGQQVDQLKTKLSGYAALLVYRYGNLCIEANPIALLPVTVEVEGEKKKIEDVAQVAVHEKYHFIVSPIYEDDLFQVGKAIMMQHPEFKQEVKTWDGYEETDPAGKYLFYTMPDVNKEYHDTLIQMVDAFYDECTEKMELAQTKCTESLAAIQADSSPEDIKKVADYVDEITSYYNKLRDETHDSKTKEVEDAYAEYQAKQDEKKAQEQEKLQEQGNPLQMNLNPES